MNTLICELDRTIIRTNLQSELSLYKFNQVLNRLFSNKQSTTSQELRHTNEHMALPFNSEVIDYLKERKQTGGKIILLSNVDEQLVRKYVQNSDLFDSIHTPKEVSLSSSFDYLGSPSTPITTWEKAHNRFVVEPANSALSNQLHQAQLKTERSFQQSKPSLHTIARAIRAHQWLKNILVFVPLIASQQLMHAEPLVKSALMFLCFSLVASFGYIVNDILDIQSDRAHTEKKNRPFASGDLSLKQGALIGAALLLTAVCASIMLSLTATLVLLAYLSLTLVYSLCLKTKLMLDVVTLGAAFTLRVVGGAAAIESELSFYLLSFSIFLFASLGMVKRYAELLNLRKQQKLTAKGRGYQVDDIAPVRTIGISMGTMSVFTLGQYINSPLVTEYYRHPTLIWLLLPLLLYWLGRLWLLANRGEVNEDPLLFAVKDRTSQLTAILFTVILWLAD